jgi:hypothetical protein
MDKTKTSGSKWPFIIGPLISVAGIVMGFTIPVGPHCAGAFDGNQTEAAGYDIAYAMTTGARSYVADACRAAAPGQMGIYFGIIGFGIAIVILGVLLRSARKPAIQPVPPAYSVTKELERLVSLRDRGILSDEQFEHQKTMLLRA